MLTTRLTERLNLKHPIIQAPMALAAGGKLAASVSIAGGLGLIGGGYGDFGWLDTEFSAAGNAPVGCGFITWSLAGQPGLLSRTLERDPVAIFLSFADPAPFSKEIKAAGASLIVQVQNVRDARRAMDVGADVIVAQGSEAGGHGETRATLTLVPEVADQIARDGSDVLLCAAGGIADGRGLAASLALGADGVVVGSRFWASEEALVHPNLHAVACEANGDSTIRSTVPDIARRRDWPSRFTARVVRNGFTERWHDRPKALQTAVDIESERYAAAWAKGDTNVANAFVGEATGMINSIEPAVHILERLVGEAEQELRRCSALVT